MYFARTTESDDVSTYSNRSVSRDTTVYVIHRESVDADHQADLDGDDRYCGDQLFSGPWTYVNPMNGAKLNPATDLDGHNDRKRVAAPNMVSYYVRKSPKDHRGRCIILLCDEKG